MNLKDALPIWELTREGISEVVVAGAVGILTDDQIESNCDLNLNLIARSLLKPWQFLACDIQNPISEWALAIGSHSGESVHLEAFEMLKGFTGVNDCDLICPKAYPLNAEESFRLLAANEGKEVKYHPCCGKHLAMFFASRGKGFDAAHYYEANHPLQIKLQELISLTTKSPTSWVKDSCGLPALACSLKSHLLLWRELGTNESLPYRTLRDLWVENPLIVGGEKRLDSDILRIGQGKILAKEGADGLLALQSDKAKTGVSVTILIKIASGYQSSHLGIALKGAIEGLPSRYRSLLGPVEEYLEKRISEWTPRDQVLHHFFDRGF